MINLGLIREYKVLEVLHINVCSLLSKWEQVNSELLDGYFDIDCLSETWLHKNMDDAMVSSPSVQAR